MTIHCFICGSDYQVQARHIPYLCRVVTLCGPGGIGKSALAAEAVWQPEVATRFPDGLIFHSFYNQPQAALAQESIARAFGQEPKPTPRDAARRVLAGKHALLLLDGAEDADDG